jgi:hypothetical protein
VNGLRFFETGGQQSAKLKAKATQKEFRQACHKAVEVRFGVCFQHDVRNTRVGVWLKDAGRGLQNRRDRVIADIARHRESKSFHHRGHEGSQRRLEKQNLNG